MFERRNGKTIARWVMEANFHMRDNNIFVLDTGDNCRSHSTVVTPFYTDDFGDALKMMQQTTFKGVATMVGADETQHTVMAEGVDADAIKVSDPVGMEGVNHHYGCKFRQFHLA